MAEWSTGWSSLDKALEAGTRIAERGLDMLTARSESDAQKAIRDIEVQRTAQLGILSQTSTIGNVAVPNWVVPAAIAGLGLVYFLKKK